MFPPATIMRATVRAVLLADMISLHTAKSVESDVCSLGNSTHTQLYYALDFSILEIVTYIVPNDTELHLVGFFFISA